MCVLIGGVRVFPQGDGPDVQLRVFGDEFYSRYETLDGYTVVYDPGLEKYCYVILVRGSFASSGTPISKPVPQGIRRHIQEERSVRNRKFDDRYDMMRPASSLPPGVMRTLGKSNGLLRGRQLSIGKVKGLTVLINFKNEKTSITPDQVEALSNGDNYSDHGNYCSVKTYFQTISSGKLEYTAKVVGPITLSKNRNHYIANPLMREALNIVHNELGLDFSEFDSNGNGVIDAINFLYAGSTVYEDWLWPHNHTVNIEYGGLRTQFYTIQSLGRSPVDLKIGTLCHETGHLLCRFPDLYDYGRRDGDSDPSEGMGRYCLMSSGNHLNNGRTPAPVSSYLRDLAGWTDKEVILNNMGECEALHGDYGTVLRHETDRSNEYFLIENRSRIGMDAYCPSEGLAIYHCDTLGSNEWQGGTADKHYQCALIQADGRRDLENNQNRGDANDLFSKIDGLALSNTTVPSSKAWGGIESGLNLFDISQPGKTISFKAGEPEIVLPFVTKEDIPNLLIPDKDPKGISRTLTINKSGTIKNIEVSVDISHTYRGDLEVAIHSPSGDLVVLHNQEGKNMDDLKKTFDPVSLPALAGLKGKSMEGDWTLSVKDKLADDMGRLNSWKFTIEYELTDRVARGEVTPGTVIPDNDYQGISSVIPISQEGIVKDIKVGVDISHTYIGDLQIDLTSPSSQRVTLFQFREGGNKVDLMRTFDPSSLPALAAMAGTSQQVNGDWTLLVIDNAGQDEGTLKGWSIELVY